MPGLPTVATRLREIPLSLPLVVALLAAGLLTREVMKPPPKKLLPKMPVNEKYSPPMYITHVDRATNTLLKDQSHGAGLSLPVDPSYGQSYKPNLERPYRTTKSDYFNESLQSPGVRLVAGAVARGKA